MQGCCQLGGDSWVDRRGGCRTGEVGAGGKKKERKRSPRDRPKGAAVAKKRKKRDQRPPKGGGGKEKRGDGFSYAAGPRSSRDLIGKKRLPQSFSSSFSSHPWPKGRACVGGV